MIYDKNEISPIKINYSVSYQQQNYALKAPTKKNPDFIGTKDLAERIGIKPHTLRLWVSNGKQAKEGFPKPSHRIKELQFRMSDIIDWEKGKRF